MIRHYVFLLVMLLGAGQLAVAQAQQATDAEQQTMPAKPAAEQEEQASDMQDAAMGQTGFSSGSVMRSTFTTRIEDREPVDEIEQLENDTREVYFFTELRDMEGQTARHRWMYEGDVMAEVEFNVRGPRWRVWSSKRILPDWTGEWTVSVINAADEVIASDSFSYVEATSADDDAGAMPAEDAEAAMPEDDVEEMSAAEQNADDMTPDESTPAQE